MARLLTFFLIILLIACNDKSSKESPSQDRDSIMTKYFQAIDSLPYLDTLDLHFKLLKAYHKNDTAYLRNSYKEITNLLKSRQDTQESHFCENPVELNTLNFEEAYRFSYGAAFCNKAVNMTIGKSGDSITLEFYLFEYNNTQTECKTIKHTTQLASQKIWDTLLNGLHQSDFWGLKEDNGRRGMDGSGLRVTGFEMPKNAFEGRYKTIYRWAAEDMSIGILFKKLLYMSEIKVDCFHF